MSCPGLHCPGCSEGGSLAVLAVGVIGLAVAYEAVGWVAERIWWIGGTLAVCFALSVAVSMWMERWAVVRSVRFAARHGIASQADVDALNPAGVAWLQRNEPAAQITGPVAAAIPPAAQLVFNVYNFGGDADQIAARLMGLPGEMGQRPAIRVVPGTTQETQR